MNFFLLQKQIGILSSLDPLYLLRKMVENVYKQGIVCLFFWTQLTAQIGLLLKWCGLIVGLLWTNVLCHYRLSDAPEIVMTVGVSCWIVLLSMSVLSNCTSLIKLVFVVDVVCWRNFTMPYANDARVINYRSSSVALRNGQWDASLADCALTHGLFGWCEVCVSLTQSQQLIRPNHRRLDEHVLIIIITIVFF